MLKKIESLIITSDKYSEAISFFRDKLRFEIPVEGADMARFELNGFPIFVAKSDNGSCTFISIETDDIENDYRLLGEKGVVFPNGISALKNGDKASFFSGPVGIQFMLFQPGLDSIST
jgi:hypothetical protein